MTKAKKEEKTEKIEEKPEEETKFQLAGFNINEFKAKPLETNISTLKDITNIPVKKPNGQQFFRIHPKLEFTADCLKWKEENDRLYLIHPKMVQILQEQLLHINLHLGMYLTGRSLFFFPVQLQKGNEKWNSWHEAQAEAVDKAKTHWIRMEASREQGGYILYKAQGELEEPEWPNRTIEELLAIAFKSHTIVDEDHVIVKQLRGL